MGNLVDRTGHVYGRLTVVSKQGVDSQGRAQWNCICECGELRVVRGSNLSTGRSRSCGCSSIKHGHTINAQRTSEFTTWSSMRGRCSNPSSSGYHLYGGRGISVCSRWTSSFENFLSDMGPKPSKRHTIDRIDSDGNYEPSNVRWATYQEQSDNRRVTIWHTLDGVTKTRTQWSRDLGGSLGLVRLRLNAGWTEERALSTPKIKRRVITP